MPSPIGVLPTELFQEILNYLSHGDLVQLMRVSRQFHKLLEPMIWTRIKLHRFSHHEDYVYKQLREEEAVLQRPYHLTPLIVDIADARGEELYDDMVNTHLKYEEKSCLLLHQFSAKLVRGSSLPEPNSARMEHLASLVRWLCIPVNGLCISNSIMTRNRIRLDPWNVIPRFMNLEYLEVTAAWRGKKNVVRFDASARWKPMEKLKTIKLRGYVSREFVRYICSNAPNLTELQLAVINDPARPGSCVDSESGDDDDKEYEEEDKAYKEEAGRWACVDGPRPLSCLPSEIVSTINSLESLFLCRLVEGRVNGMTTLGTYMSPKVDRRILNEWTALIRANRGTLACLTLDQRIVATDNDAGNSSNVEFMHHYCNGISYQRFVRIVLPALLEEADWPKLRQIRLCGFETNQIEKNEDSIDFVGLLKDRFKKGVEVSNVLGRRIVILDRSSEIETAGDILDSSNSFDYDNDDEGLEGEPTLLWQLRPEGVKGDWAFGYQHRLS
jgi:hypothetical protein